VAHNFNIPPSTVRAIVKTFLECDGRVAKLPRGGNRRSRIEMVHVDRKRRKNPFFIHGESTLLLALAREKCEDDNMTCAFWK